MKRIRPAALDGELPLPARIAGPRRNGKIHLDRRAAWPRARGAGLLLVMFLAGALIAALGAGLFPAQGRPAGEAKQLPPASSAEPEQYGSVALPADSPDFTVHSTKVVTDAGTVETAVEGTRKTTFTTSFWTRAPGTEYLRLQATSDAYSTREPAPMQEWLASVLPLASESAGVPLSWDAFTATAAGSVDPDGAFSAFNGKVDLSDGRDGYLTVIWTPEIALVVVSDQGHSPGSKYQLHALITLNPTKETA